MKPFTILYFSRVFFWKSQKKQSVYWVLTASWLASLFCCHWVSKGHLLFWTPRHRSKQKHLLSVAMLERKAGWNVLTSALNFAVKTKIYSISFDTEKAKCCCISHKRWSLFHQRSWGYPWSITGPFGNSDHLSTKTRHARLIERQTLCPFPPPCRFIFPFWRADLYDRPWSRTKLFW